MNAREALDRHFAEELGADPAAMEPNDIAVQRTPRREGSASFAGGPEVESPVWVLVTRGRGVVSCSRLLYRVACAWAEDFAAAEHLLRGEFMEDLRVEVARSMDAQVRVEMWRVFMREGAVDGPSGVRLEVVTGPLGAGGTPLAALCPASDPAAARHMAEAGAREYGRLVRLIALR